MVLIVRGVDVSVGAVMGLASTLSAFLIPDFGLTTSILLPLVVCGLVGLGNGLLVEKGRVPPIVATIGMMWVVAVWPEASATVPHSDPRSSRASRLPWAARSRLCRSSLSGSSSWAPSPISFDPTSRSDDTSTPSEGTKAPLIIRRFRSRIRIGVYGVAGVLYGVAGLLMASYVRSGMPTVGKGYEFKAITAAVLGGIALTGGRGNIFKAIVGAVILIVLYGVITAFAVSPYIQGIIQGAILVGAVYYATRND